MTESLKLFGMPLMAAGKLTLAEQVHDILLCQIQAGRWKVGERLPSISQLAAESDLSRQPVQQAFEALREEGYLEARRGDGTYLASQAPRIEMAKGAIGIVMIDRQPDNPVDWAYYETDHWRLHAILREAAERGYRQEVYCIRREDNATAYRQLGSFFSERTRGVISLSLFPCPEINLLPEGAMPLVYLGYNAARGACVALDVESGFYWLTREVIQRGHQKILLLHRQFMVASEMRQVEGGFRRALGEAGLEMNEAAFDASRNLRSRADATEFLRRYVADDPMNPKHRATAIVCPLTEEAVRIIDAADRMGIRVPEDLSVVCMLSGPMRQANPEQRLAGIEVDLKTMVRMSFEALEEQIRTRRNAISLIRVKPLLFMGDSLAPPCADNCAKKG